MENQIQIELLANTALESKNYIQAYDYFSKLLEADVNNNKYWIGKAISAAHLSTIEQMRLSETIACIKTANKLQVLTGKEKTELSRELITIVESKILEYIKLFDKEVEKEFNALQIPAGTLYAVHQTRKLSITLSVGQKYRPAIVEYLDLLVLACELNPTKDNYLSIHRNMNYLFEQSKSRGNFFGTLNEATELNKKIKDIWDKAERKIKQIDPTISITNNSPQTSSGCFIATASTGDYNHPTVVQLRLFRDNILETTSLGRKFIKFYYRNSPPIAEYISQKRVLKKIIYWSFIKPLSVLTKSITK